MAAYLRVSSTTNSAGGTITPAGTYSSPNGELSQQELSVVRRGFKDYDRDGDGFISHRDFCEAMTAHQADIGVRTPLEVAE